MKPAAIGLRMHSGWGVLVAASESMEIIERRRIDLIGTDVYAQHRGNQPYHRAAEIGGQKAEKYIAEFTAACDDAAHGVIGQAIADLKLREYKVIAAGLILASGRKLPPLPQILASHPMIHTAEGELFRQIVRRACESLELPVLGLPERELEVFAKKRLGASCEKVLREIATAGKMLGAPWTADHKAAALAAVLALVDR